MSEIIARYQVDIPDKRLRRRVKRMLRARELDLYEIHGMCFEHALNLLKQGLDYYPYLYASKIFQILHYKHTLNSRFTHLEIFTGKKHSCIHCRELHGKIYTFDEALEQMPIPLKCCTKFLDVEEMYKKPGWCSCLWQPVIPS